MSNLTKLAEIIEQMQELDLGESWDEDLAAITNELKFVYSENNDTDNTDAALQSGNSDCIQGIMRLGLAGLMTDRVIETIELNTEDSESFMLAAIGLADILKSVSRLRGHVNESTPPMISIEVGDEETKGLIQAVASKILGLELKMQNIDDAFTEEDFEQLLNPDAD